MYIQYYQFRNVSKYDIAELRAFKAKWTYLSESPTCLSLS